MTEQQMMALKPGDIVEEKSTGDQFRFVRLEELTTYRLTGRKLSIVDKHQELAVELIPGFQYARKRVTGGEYFYFRHKRMAVKGAAK